MIAIRIDLLGQGYAYILSPIAVDYAIDMLEYGALYSVLHVMKYTDNHSNLYHHNRIIMIP